MSNGLIKAMGILVFASGVCFGIAITHNKGMHTEKHGCEYVEQTECKQVWIKG
tara:strand:+ start:334 stop:492 length:159 start_codon:yes stop_codon:yes gene_type:complete